MIQNIVSFLQTAASIVASFLLSPWGIALLALFALTTPILYKRLSRLWNKREDAWNRHFLVEFPIFSLSDLQINWYRKEYYGDEPWQGKPVVIYQIARFLLLCIVTIEPVFALALAIIAAPVLAIGALAVFAVGTVLIGIWLVIRGASWLAVRGLNKAGFMSYDHQQLVEEHRELERKKKELEDDISKAAKAEKLLRYQYAQRDVAEKSLCVALWKEESQRYEFSAEHLLPNRAAIAIMALFTNPLLQREVYLRQKVELIQFVRALPEEYRYALRCVARAVWHDEPNEEMKIISGAIIQLCLEQSDNSSTPAQIGA
jgi:hypothetical protein